MTRATYLSPPDHHRLSWACRPVREAYGTPPYLVGSVLERPSYRDIDLRLILPDTEFGALFPNRQVLMLLNVAVSDFITKTAGLSIPVDFQFQSQSEANAFDGPRNAMGLGAPQPKWESSS